MKDQIKKIYLIRIKSIQNSYLKRHDSNQKPSHSTVSFSQKPIVSKDVKESRKNSILAILKKDSNLTIKDFVKVISDCSEKTIQRELIALVEKGIIKRNGERRWSTYSLA